MNKAVILARGLGTRMRKDDSTAVLTEGQDKVAEVGVKAMIPIDRPFLDYVLSALAGAGYEKACLVIGPEHSVVRDYYQKLETSRISVDFAIQEEPIGTANAVASAEKFADGEDICVINSDNYYPASALKSLRQFEGPALVGFDRDALVEKSNIDPERIQKFAVVDYDADMKMRKIIEKPTVEQIEAVSKPVRVSMNCYRFTPEIFEACRNIEKSSRGEYELTDAVWYTIEKLGQQYTIVESSEPVLDMTSRKDVESVTKMLAGTEVCL